MASPKVLALINAFRSHFQRAEGADIPIALRQEPADVVYRALLEEDAPATPTLSPLLAAPSALAPEPGLDLAGAFEGADMGLPADLGAPELAPELGLEEEGGMAAPSVDDFLMGS